MNLLDIENNETDNIDDIDNIDNEILKINLNIDESKEIDNNIEIVEDLDDSEVDNSEVNADGDNDGEVDDRDHEVDDRDHEVHDNDQVDDRDHEVDDRDQVDGEKYKNFKTIIEEFINDLQLTFYDYEEINELKKELLDNDKKYEDIYLFCKNKYPKYFFDILYENVELFDKDTNNNIEFLPGINFYKLYNDKISENTKQTIWKYLQLILFSVVSDTDKDSMENLFGENSKLFEAINKEEFKEKIEESMKDIENLFSKDSSSNYFNDKNIPNPQEFNDHINNLMGGKIGNLAKEIAEETSKDMNIDMDNCESINDVFKNLFKNPSKLMDLVKNVSNKLDSKLKSGDIKESEILEEASSIMNNMKNMPGMGNLESMLKKMGIPGMDKGGKVDLNAFNKNMEQNLKMSKMKERMRSKINKDNPFNNPFNNSINEDENYLEKLKKSNEIIKSMGINIDGMEEFSYTKGESIEKSIKKNPHKKGKKGKKKR